MSREPWDESGIDDALRRAFEPPSLQHLHALVDDAATEAESDAPANDHPSRRPRWTVGLAVAVAAAAVLVWVLSSRSTDPAQPMLRPTPEGPKVIAMDSRREAGRQLDAFLVGSAALPPVDADCMAPVVPPNCDEGDGTPQLIADDSIRLLGECGGATGVDCAEHELPAQRAMLVRLDDYDAEVILCIEPPWADPQPVLPADSGMNIFRRTLGTYVLYEVTPLAHPVAVDRLVL